MQKPKFRTVDKSAWVFITTRLNTVKAVTMSRRIALRSGYLSTAAAMTGRAESDLPTPFQGEPLSKYLARVKSTAA